MTTAELEPSANPTPELTLGRKLIGGDKHLWGIYIALCLISIVELYSASSREVASSAIGVYGPILRHFGQLMLGFCLVVAVQRIHYRHFIRAIPLFTLLSIGLMVAALFIGKKDNGAVRSINFIIPIQPSEFIKLASVAFIALVLAPTQRVVNEKVRNSGVLIVVGMMALCALLMIRDGFTNTMILMAISLAMMVVGGIRVKYIIIVIATYASLATGYHFYSEYRYEKDVAAGVVNRSELRNDRFEDFSNPVPPVERPITTKNMQSQYSYMAQANGGLFGVFPGNSREAARLPLAFSDYIYSIIIEDMGLVGALIVLILFLWLLARASGIASRCQSTFPKLLAIGMAVFIVTQALTHMAIVTGVVPVSGQPLPLISKGGTSIIITSVAFGVMLSVSRYGVRSATVKKKKEAKPAAAIMPQD